MSKLRFESIYFSCAPENQGKPPGGQAAEAEKEEEKEAKEDKAAAKKGEGIPIPAAPATRCLYEDIEYSGRQAGAVSRTHNVTECQAWSKTLMTFRVLGSAARMNFGCA